MTMNGKNSNIGPGEGIAPSPSPAVEATEKFRSEREFLFTSQDFSRIQGLILHRAGISLSRSKFDMVYSRLARRLRILQINTFADYLRHLESGGDDEWEAFVNALTTNLTYFFREPHHFPVLAEHMRHVAASREVKVWSAAASTGEEPYSIAMTAIEEFGNFLPPVRILATDVDTNVLEKGKTGVYPMEKVEKLNTECLKRFFLRGDGKYDGLVKVRPELQQLITFRQLNLRHTHWGHNEKFDVIFCRNVLIYFNKETQREILTRIASVLRPDGLLFAGHSESFCYTTDLFETCGRTIYRLRRRPS